MKHMTNYFYFMIFLMLCLGGCSRYIDWGKSVFYQGKKVDLHAQEVRCFIRSVHVYDQLTTLGIFDALWLNDQVRVAYAQVYAAKHGLSQERYEAFVQRQLQENLHDISFYVLVSLPVHESISFVDKDAPWSMNLIIDDDSFVPVEIVPIDLSPEYQMFFGKRFNKFKVCYLVKFNAVDVEGNYLIDQGSNNLELVFNRVGRKARLMWNLANACPPAPLDPNILAYPVNKNIY